MLYDQMLNIFFVQFDARPSYLFYVFVHIYTHVMNKNLIQVQLKLTCPHMMRLFWYDS